MSRPQKYDPALGIQGNLENSLWENQYRKNEISNEVGNRSIADTENRTIVEQSLTEADLNNIEAQQALTDLDLRVLELEQKGE